MVRVHASTNRNVRKKYVSVKQIRVFCSGRSQNFKCSLTFQTALPQSQYLVTCFYFKKILKQHKAKPVVCYSSLNLDIFQISYCS